jgi:hypothetical protein
LLVSWSRWSREHQLIVGAFPVDRWRCSVDFKAVGIKLPLPLTVPPLEDLVKLLAHSLTVRSRRIGSCVLVGIFVGRKVGWNVGGPRRIGFAGPLAGGFVGRTVGEFLPVPLVERKVGVLCG